MSCEAVAPGSGGLGMHTQGWAAWGSGSQLHTVRPRASNLSPEWRILHHFIGLLQGSSEMIKYEVLRRVP